MEFKEFAQLMHSVIGGASSTGDFVRTLFDAITTDDGNSVLEEVKIETYRSYFNGYTGISRIAKKLSPYLDAEEFTSYCEDFSDATMNRLYYAFRPYIPGVTKLNVDKLLADFFETIILTAASAKRKSKRYSEKQTEQVQKENTGKTVDTTDATVVEESDSLTGKLKDDSEDTENIEAKVVEEHSDKADKDEPKTTNQTLFINNGNGIQIGVNYAPITLPLHKDDK